MAKIILDASKAERSHGCVCVHLDIGGTGPLAHMRCTSEVKNVAEAREELRLWAQEVERRAQALGIGARASLMLARGERAPNGFKKENWGVYVNLDEAKDEVAA